jgi:hypothetical protein
LPDAIRDYRFHRKYGKFPYDLHRKLRFFMNYVCNCTCDRCAEKSDSGSIAPPNSIIHLGESPVENVTPSASPAQPLVAPLSPSSHLRPLNPKPATQLTEFSRRLARLTPLLNEAEPHARITG